MDEPKPMIFTQAALCASILPRAILSDLAMAEKRDRDEDIDKARKTEEKRWRKRGAFDEAGREERTKKLAAARAYLRLPLPEFLLRIE